MKPVIIAGTGPGGLLLAQGLKKAKIPFRVFERDAALNMRAQGYRFKLTNQGVEALMSILSPEHFALLKNTCSTIQQMNFSGFNALTAEPLKGGPGPPPRRQTQEPLAADRTVFRSVLFKGLEDNVTFSKEITAYYTQEDGVLVKFTDGGSVEGSLLVGADGSWSRVRRQLLPDVSLLDSEGRNIYGKTPMTPEFLAKFNPDATKGMAFIQDASQDLPVSLLLEPMTFGNRDKAQGIELPDDYIYWVVIFRKDRANLLKLAEHPTPEECVKLLNELTAEWDPSIRALFDFQDIQQTSIISLPTMGTPLPQWKSSGRVTLLGDAIHAMPPTGGIGATTALRDAGILFKVLTEEGLGVESLTKYENEMRDYAAEAITLSHMGGAKFFNLRPMAELMPFGR